MTAPIHDFPIRDEILYQFGPQLDGDVLEVGPGSGYTAWRTAQRAEEFLAVDYAKDTVCNLTRIGLHAIWQDFTKPIKPIDFGQFDVVYSLDMLECVPKGTGSQVFSNMFAALAPDGELFVTFPNHEKFPNYYEAMETLRVELGWKKVDIFTVKLNPWAQVLYKWGHDKPLHLWRKLRKGKPSTMNYDSTWAFTHRSGLERIKWLIHGYWAILLFLIKLGGPAFEAKVPSSIAGKQIVIRAWK